MPMVFTVTTVADAGSGSFRQAILDANATGGQDEIHFAIDPTLDPDGDGVPTIRPLTPLPEITEAVVIDGYTQPGAAPASAAAAARLMVEIDGSSMVSSSTSYRTFAALSITGGGSTVRGLVINRVSRVSPLADGDGIRISGGGGNLIEGNHIGTDPSGTAAARNRIGGILIIGSPDNTIGGTSPEARNVIAGNNYDVEVDLSTSSGNVIQGNYIGLDATGGVNLGTSNSGIYLHRSARRNLVGGTDPGAGNVIVTASGSGAGVYLEDLGTTGNVVQGNFIGTDASGTVALGGGDGVRMLRAPANVIGGEAPGAGNLISGNRGSGVELNSGADRNVVQGNLIGTDVTGTLPLGNAYSTSGFVEAGMYIIGGSDNLVGGTTAAARNVISGNHAAGVYISGSSGGARNLIRGNFVGTDAGGTAALGNSGEGIRVSSSPDTTIGGAADGAGNLIAANGGPGIHISSAGASGGIVQGNLVGTDASGTTPLGNGSHGVALSGVAATVGGTAPGAGNLISGNGGVGLAILGSGTSGALVQGNRIGTDITATAALGNTFAGVAISNASGVTIGGTADGAANVISGNNREGVSIGADFSQSGNLVQGNLIGTDPSGTIAVGNGWSGVSIGYGGDNNVIGGTGPREGNVIAHNGEDGVRVTYGAGHVIRGNAIYGNARLGIELSPLGVETNDLNDADIGPNLRQNYPVLASVETDGVATAVSGSLHSTPGRTFTIDLYASPTADPTGHGEGATYLGSAAVSTDADGNGSFTVSFATVVPSGHVVSATATDEAGNTSEFSLAVAVVATNRPPTAVSGGPYALDEGGTLQLDGTASTDPDQDPATLTYEWDLDYDGVTFDVDATGARPTVGYPDDFPARVIALRVTDAGGLSDVATTTLEVRNVAPMVDPIDLPLAPILIGGEVAASATFTDPGLLDLHGATWHWGDGSSSTGVVVEPTAGVPGVVRGTHTYGAPGVYEVRLTVTDGRGSTTVISRYSVVVYDPEAGFVTGGGRIASPAGAYTADPNLTGLAYFGFVSRYKKGATTPDGQTQFNFSVADFRFHSTSYTWLVVAGAKAMYKGEGTVNDMTGYGFLLSAIDGQLNGGGGTDKFRIKIWRQSDEHVVYDNQLGSTDDADPTTEIGGGNIVIHAK